MQDWKMLDWKMTDEFTGAENDALNCPDGDAGPIKCSEISHTS